MKKINYPDKIILKKEYDELRNSRELIAKEMIIRIKDILKDLPSSSSIKSRIKDFNSFYKKLIRNSLKGNKKHTNRIDDVIGIRIVCPFQENIDEVEKKLQGKFTIVETDNKRVGRTYREFGYESVHLLIKVPDDLLLLSGSPHSDINDIIEIQIRTILQDAWAEVEHELIYKSEFNPYDEPMRRKLAALSASLYLADITFQELRKYQRELKSNMDMRRDSIFEKVDESTNALLFHETNNEINDENINDENNKEEYKPESAGDFSLYESIDDLLLKALKAHNNEKFEEAIAYYIRILELNPDDTIKALILKHRGMAFFACSNYKDAIADFAESFRLDSSSYKAVYYQGVVYSVLRQHREAIEVFNKSLEINPYQPFCLYRRGQSYYHLDDFPHALADCEAALALEQLEGAKKFKDLLLGKLKM